MSCVEVDHRGEVAVIRLNRPEVLNAINQQMWSELLRGFETLADRADLKACVLTGAGRGFCSGADLGETAWHGESPEQSTRRIEAHHQALARTIVEFPAPVIACVNGYALGGGAEIALAADIRIAAPGARFGFPEAAVGRSITGGASLLLTRAVGLSRAKRLLFTSEHIDAEQALSIGLVDEVTESDDPMPRALELAAQIGEVSASSVRLMKALVDRVALDQLDAALEAETRALVSTYAAGDIDAARERFAKRDRTA